MAQAGLQSKMPSSALKCRSERVQAQISGTNVFFVGHLASFQRQQHLRRSFFGYALGYLDVKLIGTRTLPHSFLGKLIFQKTTWDGLGGNKVVEHKKSERKVGSCKILRTVICREFHRPRYDPLLPDPSNQNMFCLAFGQKPSGWGCPTIGGNNDPFVLFLDKVENSGPGHHQIFLGLEFFDGVLLNSPEY
ncbi:MAG: hypothetical protein R2788_13755 [Saprospiraceae bacterium]